jgi:hypothetical protein
MTDEEAMQQIIRSLQDNPEGYQRVATAMLGQDRAATRQAVHDVAGVDLSEGQLDTMLSEYADKDKIAAFT